MANSNEKTSNRDAQQAEITSLGDYFKDNIRILSSIGQFSYILKIQTRQYDVSLTLQLDESYPSKAPEIIITAPRLTPEQISVVQQLLQSYSETLLNQPMILLIHSRLLQWFAENNIQSLDVNSNNPSTPIPSASRSPINVPSAPVFNHTKAESDTDQTKKSSMKTADDVISRIEWDDRLEKRYFRVGYIDRFVGLQEKSFTDFDFKVDLSTVSDRHSKILAIPKHRIQYFKYGNEIIWDKETRTDLMFGSTGNQQTIYDVIKRHENLVEENPPSSTFDNDAVEDADMDLPPARYLTSTDGTCKPNYYLSIPVTDSTLINNYVAYRDHLLSSYPTLFSSRTDPNAPPDLHLTLLTLRIETASQIEQCKAALKRLHEEIRYHCSYPEPIALEFQGIETFYDKVLYVKCKSNQRLENLRTLIIERFTEQQRKQNLNEIFFAGNYLDYRPHITLFKCKRRFSSVCQNENLEICFGKQTIDSIQLRAIGQTNNDCLFKLDFN